MPTQLPSQVVILPQYGADPGEIIWKSNVPGDNPWARIGGGPTACFGVAGQAGLTRFYIDQTGEAKIYGNAIPNITVLHDLGSESLRWRKLWVDDIDMTGSLTGGFVTLTTDQTISGKKTFTAPSVPGFDGNYQNMTIHIQDSNNHPGITLKNGSGVRKATWYAGETDCFVVHAENDDPDPAFRIANDKAVFINKDAGTLGITGYFLHLEGNANIDGNIRPATHGIWSLGSEEDNRWKSVNSWYGTFHGPHRGGFALHVEIRDTTGDRPGIIFQQVGGVSCGAIVSTNDYAFALYSKDEANRLSVRQDGHIFTYGLNAGVSEDPINFNADDFISIRMSVNNIKKARWSAGDTMCLAVQNRDDTFEFCVDQYGKVYVGEPVDDYTQNSVQIHRTGLTLGIGAGMNGYPTGHAAYPAQILMKGYNGDYAITVDDGTAFVNHYVNCYYDGGANFKFGTSVGAASRFVIGPGSFNFQVSTTPASRGANIAFRDAIIISSDGNVIIPGLVSEVSGMVTLTTTQTISGTKTFNTINLLTTHFIAENPLGGEGGQFSLDGAPGYSNIQMDSVQNYLRIWTFDGQDKTFEIRNHAGNSFHMNLYGNFFTPYTVTGGSLVQSQADMYAASNLRGMHVHLERNAYPSIWFHCDTDINGPTDWRIYAISNNALILRNRAGVDPFGFSQGGLLNINSSTETWALTTVRGIAVGANSPHGLPGSLGNGQGYATIDISENAPRFSSISFHNTGRSVMMMYLDNSYNLHVAVNNGTPFQFCINNPSNTDVMIVMDSGGNITNKGRVESDVLIVNHKSTVNAGGGVEIRHHDQQRGVWTAGDSAAFSVQSYSTFRLVVTHEGKLFVNKTFDDGLGTHLQVQGSASIHGFCKIDNLLQVGGNGQYYLMSYNSNFRIDQDGSFHGQYANLTSYITVGDSYRLRGTVVIDYYGQFTGSLNTQGTCYAASWHNTSTGYQVNGVTKIDSNGVYKGSVQCYDNVFGNQFGIMGQYVGRTQYFNIGGQILNFVGGILV
jgi:hypothetical protein